MIEGTFNYSTSDIPLNELSLHIESHFSPHTHNKWLALVCDLIIDISGKTTANNDRGEEQAQDRWFASAVNFEWLKFNSLVNSQRMFNAWTQMQIKDKTYQFVSAFA